MRVIRRMVVAAMLGGLTAPLAAQDAGSVREVQVRKLELERSLLVAMIDSMPAELFRDKVTEPQRDFAQQLHHAASAAAAFTQRFMTADQPSLASEDEALSSPAALRAYVNAVYDFAVAACGAQTDEDRNTTVEFFGQQIPKWMIWDELHQHTMWTVGQVVANFRKHGMAPPAFLFF